jgi:hypothetical protein
LEVAIKKDGGNGGDPPISSFLISGLWLLFFSPYVLILYKNGVTELHGALGDFSHYYVRFP